MAQPHSALPRDGLAAGTGAGTSSQDSVIETHHDAVRREQQHDARNTQEVHQLCSLNNWLKQFVTRFNIQMLPAAGVLNYSGMHPGADHRATVCCCLTSAQGAGSLTAASPDLRRASVTKTHTLEQGTQITVQRDALISVSPDMMCILFAWDRGA